MTLLLGVDGGGSKTHALVADERGQVQGFAVSGGSNWEDIGIEATAATLRAIVLEALGAAGAAPADIVGSVFGLAGMDFETDRVRLSIVAQTLGFGGPSEFLNDAFVALRAGANRPWGVVVIGGSGSVAAGRNREGATFRTLGLGRVFGDVSDATEVSNEAVRAVAEAYTERGPATSLTELVRRHVGSASVIQLIESLSRHPVEEGTFAPLVFEAAEGGDQVARGIIEASGVALGASACLVARRLGMERDEFELVLEGGLFRASSRLLLSSLEMEVRKSAPLAKPVRLETPPVVGSVLLAMELAGLRTDAELHATLAVGAISALAGAAA